MIALVDSMSMVTLAWPSVLGHRVNPAGTPSVLCVHGNIRKIPATQVKIWSPTPCNLLTPNIAITVCSVLHQVSREGSFGLEHKEVGHLKHCWGQVQEIEREKVNPTMNLLATYLLVHNRLIYYHTAMQPALRYTSRVLMIYSKVLIRR